MTVMETLKEIFGIASHDSARRASVIAMKAAESINESRELNEHLQIYKRADDPFQAMMADLQRKRTLRDDGI